MVLWLATIHSLQIHWQTDMIGWTWLSSCLKALLAAPGLRFLIFVVSVTARPLFWPTRLQLRAQKRGLNLHYLHCSPSLPVEPKAGVPGSPKRKLIHWLDCSLIEGHTWALGNDQMGVKGRQRALYFARPSCKRAQRLPLWSVNLRSVRTTRHLLVQLGETAINRAMGKCRDGEDDGQAEEEDETGDGRRTRKAGDAKSIKGN